MKVAVEQSVEIAVICHVTVTLLAPFRYLEIGRCHIHLISFCLTKIKNLTLLDVNS
jgi:hypothetical protein